jgi:hypothetical protein
MRDQVFTINIDGQQVWKAEVDGVLINADFNSKGAALAAIPVERRRREAKASVSGPGPLGPPGVTGPSVAMRQEDLDSLLVEVALTKTKVTSLFFALSRYGRHDDTCPLLGEPNLPGDPRCTCGFSNVLVEEGGAQ